jgi:hypothetical protein
MIPVFMADLSFVCVDVLFIGGILSNLMLDIGFQLCTSVFYGENPINSSYFEGRKILKPLNLLRWPRL